jgi:hypothetical protein
VGLESAPPSWRPGDLRLLARLMQFPSLHIVLGHLLGDLPQVALHVDQVGAVLQQVGGQGVPGLMGDAVTEVEGDQPFPEGIEEPTVADAPEQVAVTHPARKQRDGFALR